MDPIATAKRPTRLPTRKRRLPAPRSLTVLIAQTLWASTADRIALAAAGCAFWGMMALFPAISTMVSAIGLVVDPESVEPQLHLLDDLLPDIAFLLIEDRVHELLGHPAAELSLNLAVSSALTLFSSAAGTKAMLSGVSIAYQAENARGFLHFQLIGIAMTVAAVLGGVTTLLVLLALQPALSLVSLPGNTAALVHQTSLSLLVLAFAAFVAMLYRFGPERGAVPDRALLPGVILATVIWLAASMALTLYVNHMSSFGATYGSLGAVAGVMLWLYAAAYAVLLGAEMNARVEAFRRGN